MALNLYRNTDVSAPIMDGTAGSLIAVLDACLVNGYGSKTSAGWTKPFSTTNVGVYLRPSPANQTYLRIDDTGAGAAGGREAYIVCYDSMTGHSTGQGRNPYQYTSLPSNGLVIRKSNVATSTVVAWDLVADEYGFILICHHAYGTDTENAGHSEICVFQDIKPEHAFDTNNTLLIGKSFENTANGRQDGIGTIYELVTVTPLSYFLPVFIQKDILGMTTGKPVQIINISSILCRTSMASQAVFSGSEVNAAITFADPITNKIVIYKDMYKIFEPRGSSTVLRGTVRYITALACAKSNINGAGYRNRDIITIDGDPYLLVYTYYRQSDAAGCILVKTQGDS